MRTIADLPWRAIPVVLRWDVRRFSCDNAECNRRIFAEQLVQLVGRRQRSTKQFDQQLARIGITCGGEPGARLAADLGMLTSGDTILRRVRKRPVETVDASPRRIGIDDFALCKGQDYGTVIVDHDSRRVIDLLPERSSESTATWLKAQPHVEIVTRDRSGIYASGIEAANPDVIQVADRFHLHVNLREAIVRLLDRHHADVTNAAKVVEAAPAELAKALPVPDAPSAEPLAFVVAQVSKAAQLSACRRSRRHARYERVRNLHEQGVGIRAIARQMKMSRRTVCKFLRAGSFPEQAKRKIRRSTDAFADKLKELWDSGVHNAVELHRAVQQLGFSRSVDAVRRLVASWREPAIQAHTSGPKPKERTSEKSKLPRISSNRLSWILLRDEIEREPQEQRLIEKLRLDCEPVRQAVDMAREFPDIVTKKDSGRLMRWIEQAMSGLATELKGFAEGLLRDWASVKAAVELPWRNGRAEGHVNRIKLIKRLMYGRAKFDLLRIRVLARGP